MKENSAQKKYYLSEFELYDGDCFVTFNIVDLNPSKNEITVAVTKEGKISVITFDLRLDKSGLYFEYGPYYEKISLDDFDEVE